MTKLHLSPRRSFLFAATIAIIVSGAVVEGAELSGVVLGVMGEKIAIRISPDVLPNPGDSVEVFDTVPDLGDIALDCEWQVESAQGDTVLAVTQDKSRATAQPDYKAVIYSPNPRRIRPVETEGKPMVKEPPPVVKTADKTPPTEETRIPDGPTADGGSVVRVDDISDANGAPGRVVWMDKGLFGDGTGSLEPVPVFDPGPGGGAGVKPDEVVQLDKGLPGENDPSQQVVVVFPEETGASTGVTLDDVVRLNQGSFGRAESAGGAVSPADLATDEPWVTQWQVEDTRVDLPGGGRAGLYLDCVRSGQANPSPGRRGILYVHPLDSPTPARITRSVILQGPWPVLRLAVCGNRDVDGGWLLVVTVDSARLGPERLVRGIDGWQDLTYDLSGFSAEQPVLTCVEVYAADEQNACAFFDSIEVEDEVPASPPDEPAPPLVARVERLIVEDNFDLENGGRGQASYDDFRNWYVRGGEVDLLGHGYQDAYPDHGLYLDMDGSGYAAGTLQSKGAYRLRAGLYRLQFDLAGNPERTRNTMTVSLGKLYSESFTLDAQEPFRTISREIGVEKALNASLVFKHAGRDRAGLLLDNISLVAISYPGTGPGESLPPRPVAYVGIGVAKREGAGFDIVDVARGSPAELAGLRKGDFISLIDGGSLAEPDLGGPEFVEMVAGLPVGQPVRFTIQREGKLLDIWVRPKPKE